MSRSPAGVGEIADLRIIAGSKERSAASANLMMNTDRVAR